MTPAPTERGWLRRTSPLLVASAGLHGVAAASLLVAPQSWPIAAAAVAANHAGLTVAGLLPRCGWLGPNVTRLPTAARGVVALTFDDGPDPEVTPRVLDLLDAARAQATFFCIAERAARHPDLIAALRARGHGVENHTYHHHNTFAFGGPGRLRREIALAQQMLARSGETPRFFRPPAGIQNPWLPGVLAAAGLTHVSWTRRGFDTMTPDTTVVAARLLRRLAAGDVLVLHDGNSARDRQGRPVVLDALARVLEALEAAGLRSVALHAALPASRDALG